MKWSFNAFALVIYPIHIWALIATYGNPVFWVLLVLLIKDFKLTFTWGE